MKRENILLFYTDYKGIRMCRRFYKVSTLIRTMHTVASQSVYDMKVIKKYKSHWITGMIDRLKSGAFTIRF